MALGYFLPPPLKTEPLDAAASKNKKVCVLCNSTYQYTHITYLIPTDIVK